LTVGEKKKRLSILRDRKSELWEIAIKQLCISIQLWLIYTISLLWVCCSRIDLDLPDHFSKPLFHPIVTPSISNRHWPHVIKWSPFSRKSSGDR
jgi:hypothetical protein